MIRRSRAVLAAATLAAAVAAGPAAAAPPAPIERPDAQQQVLDKLGDQHSQLKAIAETLDTLVEAATTPASLHPLTLTPARPETTHDSKDFSAAVGLINPLPNRVFLGLGGARGRAGAGALEVPAARMIVLPVSAADIEVGAEPGELPDGDSRLFLLRFKTAQPAFVGVL